MSSTTFASIDPRDPLALSVLTSYFTEVADRWEGASADPAWLQQTLNGPEVALLQGTGGDLVIARRGESIVGCGGVRWIDYDTAELTAVYTFPSARGAGIGTDIVTELERRARLTGRHTVRLDTREDLVEARALYAGLGYAPVPAFNTDPYAQIWLAKSLA
ncbi:GNAT family N-acetyltransferase [Mycetocola tolaasinivorans]|nr:GNAT family N-acetyltransferase [Mycetocola tolaasinivorans]